MRANPEIVNKLERILEAGKRDNMDHEKLAVKVSLKAIELLSFQCGGGKNIESLANLTKSCIEKAFDVALSESINLLHKGDFNPRLVATKIALRVSAILLKASCARLRKCTRRNTEPSKNNENNALNNARNNTRNNTRNNKSIKSIRNIKEKLD
jgi:hypothetical protein